MDDLFEDPMEELVRSDVNVTVCFEAFSRLVDSHTAFEDLLRSHEAGSLPSFEAAAKPLLTAITSEAGYSWTLSDISVESVKTVAASVIKAAITALQNFFKALIDFLANVDLAATWLSRKIAFLERQVATTKGMRPSEPTIKLGRSGRYMRVHGHQVEDAARLEMQLKQLHDVVHVMVHQYRNVVLTAGQELPGAARGKTGDDLAKALVDVIARIPFADIASKCQMHAAPYERFHRNGVQATNSLLGGLSLFYLNGNLKEKGLSGMRFHGFLFETTGRNELKIEKEYELATLQPGQIGSLPAVIRSLLDVVVSGSNGSVRSQASRVRSTLDTFLKTSSLEASDMDAVRKTVSTVTNWMQQPSRSMMVHSMSVCRAALAYCHASIKTYQ